MQPLSLQNRGKARESYRAGQIVQLKMAKTLCKGDEKQYVPKYCCLSFFCGLQVERSVLQPASRHTGSWNNADTFLHIPFQWTRSWAGQGGLNWWRCAPTSAMSIRVPDRVIAHPSKGQLHPVHWASPVLGQTQFEHMVLNYFSWSPVQFLLLFQVQFSLLSTCDKADRMLNTGWLFLNFFFYHDSILDKMFHVPRGLLHPADNIFFIQTFSMRALVLLVFSLLKTAESGCSQGSIDRALWLLNSSTLFCFCFEHLTLPNSHLQYTTVTIVAQTKK